MRYRDRKGAKGITRLNTYVILLYIVWPVMCGFMSYTWPDMQAIVVRIVEKVLVGEIKPLRSFVWGVAVIGRAG